MALEITYGDIYNIVLSLIKTACQNIDTYDAVPGGHAALPTSLRSGWSRTVTKSFTTPVKRRTKQAYGIVTVVDTFTNIVYEDVNETHTVSNSFQRYMSSCGVWSKISDPITYRGLIGFLTCAYRYIAARVVEVINEDTGEWGVVYNAQTTPIVVTIQEATPYIPNANDIVAYVNALISNYTKTSTNKYSLALNYNYPCSSSSSSSSSSSNCSSSMFIAYMNLD